MSSAPGSRHTDRQAARTADDEPRTLASRLPALIVLLPLPATARPFEVSVPGSHVRVAWCGAQSVISGPVTGRHFFLALPAGEGRLCAPARQGRVRRRPAGASADPADRLPVPPRSPDGPAWRRRANRPAGCRSPAQAARNLPSACPQRPARHRSSEISREIAAANLVVERQVFAKPAEHARASHRVNDDASVAPDKVEHLP